MPNQKKKSANSISDDCLLFPNLFIQAKYGMAMLPYIFLLCALANRSSYQRFNDGMMMKTIYFKEFDIGLVRLNSALRLSDYVQVENF